MLTSNGQHAPTLDACHIDMSRFKTQFSPTSVSSMNAHESMLRNNYGLSSSNPMNSKDTEKNKVHFSNASNGPEKDDIISLYGTPKEEMLPGVSADGYRAEDEESLSHKGKLYLILKMLL